MLNLETKPSKMLLFLFMILIYLCGHGVSAGRTCADVDVPPCPQRANRDILFLVDASESMDPDRFYRVMLDFTQSIYCAFDRRDVNRAGMVIFSSRIYEAIEFKTYSPEQWFTAVEALRATANLCCSCCTPTANAFNLARSIFERVPSD